MSIRLATKTLDAIAAHMDKDQGASWRTLMRDLIPQAEDVFRGEEDPFRSHLGASIIGRDCARELWYSFHWTTAPRFEGRILRLFNRGHLEEPRIVALLLMIGCQVWQYDSDGNQFRIKGHKGHFGGGMDGVVLGIPDLPEEPMLAEFKTHALKSFTTLKDKGVRESKFEHYIQMQTYMGKNNLRYGIYIAVCKNDDELYAEIIEFNQELYVAYQDRSIMIIDADSPPPRINNSPGWFKCRFCDQAPVCHGTAQPAINCRTCRWATPIEDGQWVCENPKLSQVGQNLILDKGLQLSGCGHYEVHPLMKAKP